MLLRENEWKSYPILRPYMLNLISVGSGSVAVIVPLSNDSDGAPYFVSKCQASTPMDRSSTGSASTLRRAVVNRSSLTLFRTGLLIQPLKDSSPTTARTASL